MCCWRNLLGVTYIDRKTNIEIIASIKPKRTLEAEIVKLALSYFGRPCTRGESGLNGATADARKDRWSTAKG